MRGRLSHEPRFLEGQMEAQRSPVTCLRLPQQGAGRAGPGARVQPGAEERLGRSQGQALPLALARGFWNMVRGQDPASKALGPVSPKDLLTDRSRLGRPVPADGVKCLAGAQGRVHGASPSPWADSSGAVGPHGGGWVVKLLHWSGS